MTDNKQADIICLFIVLYVHKKDMNKIKNGNPKLILNTKNNYAKESDNQEPHPFLQNGWGMCRKQLKVVFIREN